MSANQSRVVKLYCCENKFIIADEDTAKLIGGNTVKKDQRTLLLMRLAKDVCITFDWIRGDQTGITITMKIV